jgi:hypothetical protein
LQGRLALLIAMREILARPYLYGRAAVCSEASLQMQRGGRKNPNSAQWFDADR